MGHSGRGSPVVKGGVNIVKSDVYLYRYISANIQKHAACFNRDACSFSFPNLHVSKPLFHQRERWFELHWDPLQEVVSVWSQTHCEAVLLWWERSPTSFLPNILPDRLELNSSCSQVRFACWDMEEQNQQLWAAKKTLGPHEAAPVARLDLDVSFTGEAGHEEAEARGDGGGLQPVGKPRRRAPDKRAAPGSLSHPGHTHSKHTWVHSERERWDTKHQHSWNSRRHRWSRNEWNTVHGWL